VAEIVLQQTRVIQGTPYIERFLKRFPTIEKLASARQDSVLKLWEGLGYYSRARNLHKAARIVVREFDGILPTTAHDWQSLPGIGPYTAGAIASIAHDEQVPVVDGNVKRVLTRLTDCPDNIDLPKTTDVIWDWMAILVKGKSPGDFNQSIMELGANICTPKNPACASCPVHTFCEANRNATQSIRPVRARKKKVPHHHIVIAAIRKNGRYLLGKRPPKGLLGGLWEFPGGKVEPGETHEQALAREIKEELAITIHSPQYLTTVKHAYTHFKVTLHIYLCKPEKGTPKPKVHTHLKWMRKKDFAKLAFPKANHKFLSKLP
jgi:A/G-specific adenine glycosylase